MVTPTRAERVPPHDLEAEEAVLGAMMLSPTTTTAVRDVLRADDFYRAAHAMIYAAIVGMAQRGDPVDAIAVGDELRRAGTLERVGGGLYLHHLVESVPTPASATYYASIVTRAAALRRVIDAANAALGRAYAGQDDASVIAAGALETIRNAADPGGDGVSPLDGATFAFDEPKESAAVWGDGQEVVWSSGEPFLLVGPDGVGKTTVALRLALALAGMGRPSLLGLSIPPSSDPVLYVAADRPRQIRRAFRRMVTEDQRDGLRDRLRFWARPLPFDLSAQPAQLAAWAKGLGCRTVILDSLGAMVPSLDKDENGSAVAIALGHAVAAELEVMALFHPRKEGQDSKRPPNKLADVYGSRWLTAMSGSVVVLWGSPGDPVVQFFHRKQPMAEVGPLRVFIDHETGAVRVHEGSDPLTILRGSGGLTAKQAAIVFFGSDSEADQEKARRRLDRWKRDGLAYRKDAEAIRGAVKSPALYFATTPERRPR